MQDPTTKRYFNKNIPEYSEDRFEELFLFLKNKKGSLLEIGCGNGKLMDEIYKRFGIRAYGLEYAKLYKKKMSQRTIENTYFGSVLDNQFVKSIDKRFDFVVISHTLHHLTGNTVTQSRELVEKSIVNCLRLLKKKGKIIVIEPNYEPRLQVNLLFYAKRIFSRFSAKRITILGYWNNIGPPVVNFYGRRELVEILQKSGLMILQIKQTSQPVGKLRKILLFRKYESFIVLGKR